MRSSCFREILEHTDELLLRIKLKMEEKKAEKQIAEKPFHWGFCYSNLRKLSQSYYFLILRRGTKTRDAVSSK